MRRLLLIVSALCLIVVGVAAFQGAPILGAPRWGETPPDPGITAVPSAGGQPSPTTTPPALGPEQPLPPLDVPWILVALVIALALLAAFVVVRRSLGSRARQSTPIEVIDEAVVIDAPPPDESGGVPAPAIRRGLDAARDRLAEEGNPGDAIVAAWRGLEEAAEDSGIPRRASQTPSEFTASLLARVAGTGDDVRLLLGLYLSVRYGGHVADERQIAAARAAVDRLRERWGP